MLWNISFDMERSNGQRRTRSSTASNGPFGEEWRCKSVWRIHGPRQLDPRWSTLSTTSPISQSLFYGDHLFDHNHGPPSAKHTVLQGYRSAGLMSSFAFFPGLLDIYVQRLLRKSCHISSLSILHAPKLGLMFSRVTSRHPLSSTLTRRANTS